MVAVSPADWGAEAAMTEISVQPSPLRPRSALSTPWVSRAAARVVSARSVGVMTVIGWVPRSG